MNLTRDFLLFLRLHDSSKDSEDLEDNALAIKVQYLALIITAFLIMNNVQSFLRKLLVTLKYLLRDNEI